jgi:DNA polymerase
MARLHLDLETRSTLDLRRTGVYRYARHPSTDVILACWAVDDGPVETWFAGEPLDVELIQALKRATVIAHNAGFERQLLEHVLGPRYGWPAPSLDRWDDTAARAARMALPRSLDGAAQALGLDVRKDAEGKRLMLRMCRPRSVGDDGKITWWDDDAKTQRLARYCATDVEVERLLDRVLRPLSPMERRIWQFTEEVNDIGVPVDTAFANEAIRVASAATDAANDELQRLTGGEVRSVGSMAAMKAWLRRNGLSLLEAGSDCLNRKTIENLLAGELPANVRRVLELRFAGGKSSVAKYEAIVDRADDDGRVRGNLLYHGASTGRWAGAGVQLQNLPRATVEDWEAARAALQPDSGSLGVLSKMLRGTIVAPAGHRLLWADYAAIEARGVAWLAGQTDLVQLFASGGKVYEAMAAAIFGTTPDRIAKDSTERFLGKTVVLGCGYAMGAQKFQQACAAQGQVIDDTLAHRAVSTYRSRYPYIPALWKELNAAALQARQMVAAPCAYNGIQFLCDEDWMTVRLPSGRKLYYRNPQVVKAAGPFGARLTLEYDAVNSLTKKWERERTFGGKLTENIVQGICRDLIAAAMLALQRRGYRVIASVHDEIVCEMPIGRGSAEEMLEVMCDVPDWAKGFPISAEAKEATRYGK